MDKLDAIFIKNIAQFKIYKTRSPFYKRKYIIWNTDFEFKQGHSHRYTLSECESITQHILNSTLPNRNCDWKSFNDLIISYIRLTDDEYYINHLLNLVNHKVDIKKCKFYNERSVV